MPYALPIGMISSFIGIAIIAFTTQYWIIIIAVLFIGFGSAIFHPEGSRVSFMAAGSKEDLLSLSIRWGIQDKLLHR